MGQERVIEAQNASLLPATRSQQQIFETGSHIDEKQLTPQADFFRAEALEHSIRQKREAAAPIHMTIRFSWLLWLTLCLLLLSLVALGILLNVFAGISILG